MRSLYPCMYVYASVRETSSHLGKRSTVFMFRHFFFIDVSSQRIWWCMCMRHCRFHTCKMLKTSVCISQSTINPFRCHVYINALCMFNTQFLPSHSLTRTHTYVAPLSDWMHLAHLLSCMWCYMLFLSFIQWIFAITFFSPLNFFFAEALRAERSEYRALSNFMRR